MTPTLALPLLAPGWFFTPSSGCATRPTASLEEPAKTPSCSCRGAAWIAASCSSAIRAGEGSTQTLEPRLFYVYIPYRNQDAIPLFDTALAEFNYAQLFTENRFVGGDRFGDANQLTLALTTRLLRANGAERLRATIGQRYYFEDERVGLTPTSPLRTAEDPTSSPRSARGSAPLWSFDVTTQYNRPLQRWERVSTAVSYRPPRF